MDTLLATPMKDISPDPMAPYASSAMLTVGSAEDSPEEAQAVAALVHGIPESKATWINRDGLQEPVIWEDIVPVSGAR